MHSHADVENNELIFLKKNPRRWILVICWNTVIFRFPTVPTLSQSPFSMFKYH